jgi:WD40 repeat protein
VYDPDRGLVLADLDLPARTRVRAFRMSDDSRRMITIAGIAKPISPVLWDLESYRRITTLETLEHKGAVVFSARFVRGGQQILTAGNDGAVRSWDGSSGEFGRTYLVSSLIVADAALSPDATTVVTVGGDGLLRFWDVSSGRVIWTLHAHKPFISGVHFEGADVVTRSRTGEISRWHLTKLPESPERIGLLERYLHCLPLRFDETTGGLVDQQPETACDISPR